MGIDRQRWQGGRHRRMDQRYRTAAGQRHRIEDQHHLAVTEHCRAIDANDPGKLGANILDDDFLVAAQFIDQHRRPLRAGAQQQNPVLAMHFGHRLGITQQMRQEVEGIAMALPFHLAGLTNLGQPALLHFHDLFNHGRRYGVGMIADAHQQGLRYRQGERQIEPEGRPLAGLRHHLDPSAQLADGGLHHIHADAAPGQLRQFSRRRESRLEDEIKQY